MKVKKKLNKTFVDSLPYPEKGQVFYWDADLQGFGMYIGTQSKTWFVEKRVTSKTARITLGKYPSLNAEQARRSAIKALNSMANGINPILEKREQKIKSVTLDEVFASFLSDRPLKPKTIEDYKGIMKNIYPDWQRMPIVEITKDMVQSRHKKIGEERGEAYANLGGRTLRSVLNYAIANYELAKGASILTDNPFSRLSNTKAWFRVDRRTGHLKPHQLKGWFDAVLAIDNDTIKDYLIFILLTGTRKNEAAKLQWGDIDLIDRSYNLRDPKNKNPVQLPLSDYLLTMLTRRKANSTSDFVFPGKNKLGYIGDIRAQVEKVIGHTSVTFILHDLRRTFLTTAESLDIPYFSLKALVNHKSGDDVTSGYVQINVERLRKPMQAITDFILKAGYIKEQKVHPINQKVIA